MENLKYAVLEKEKRVVIRRDWKTMQIWKGEKIPILLDGHVLEIYHTAKYTWLIYFTLKYVLVK